MPACPTCRLRRIVLAGWLAMAIVLPGAALAQAVAGPTAGSDQPTTSPASPTPPPILPGMSDTRPEPASPPAPSSSAAFGSLPHDLSPWAMFMNADIVVKAVMVGLGFASLVTWTIWVAKSLQLLGARGRALRSTRALLKADGLPDLKSPSAAAVFRGGPVTAFVYAAAHERDRSLNLPPDGIKERVAIALQRVEARAARSMTRGTGLVATIGSTAPFVGLFGTVWGIMNSFVGISQAHTTNLAVVAPGIAEALLATAIGLVAAIPAVVIYNQFARSMAGYKALLSDASAEVMRHLSRDLDRSLAAAE